MIPAMHPATMDSDRMIEPSARVERFPGIVQVHGHDRRPRTWGAEVPSMITVP